MKVHASTRKLVAGTHGRSMWTLDLGLATSAGEQGTSAPFALTSHPNPFNPRTTLRFRLDREERLRLDVYDASGRRVARLLDETLPAGEHSLEWNARNADGRELPSGVYFARLEGATLKASEKLVLVR
jgi:hypothetical protein